MRGCLSYEVVSLMRRGASPMEACREALTTLVRHKLSLGEDNGSISLIALDPRGDFGAATTLSVFPFAAGAADEIALYAADGRCSPLRRVTEQEMEGEP